MSPAPAELFPLFAIVDAPVFPAAEEESFSLVALLLAPCSADEDDETLAAQVLSFLLLLILLLLFELELEELLFVLELEMAEEDEDDCAAFDEEFNETEEDDDTSPTMVLLTASVAVADCCRGVVVEVDVGLTSDPLSRLLLLVGADGVVLSSAATEAVAFACSLASSFRFLAAGGSTELSINSVLDIGWHQERF